tara:strand:- start:628 stop:1311 length:684 start_codon:yes stop_codon:yes gene_type:complete
MVQNTLVIQNQAAQAAREDIEKAIQAVATNNSDPTTPPTASTAPPQTYPNMWWYDTFTNLLNIRNEADTAWLDVGYVDQTDGLEILDNTKVVTTAGADAGLLGDQTTVTWETGTGTTESLVSPAKVKASVIANVPDTLGVGQTWASVTRVSTTWYQNSTGRAIMVAFQSNGGDLAGFVNTVGSGTGVQVTHYDSSSGTRDGGSFIVPNTHWYRFSGSTSVNWCSILS